MTGAYITHDGGESWRMFNLGAAVKFFLFDPADPKTIYAKTFGPQSSMEKDRPLTTSWLLRSSDEGRTWQRVRADSPAGQLTALAPDPADPRTLYGVLNTSAGPILSTSNDRGATWSRVADLPPGAGRTYGADRGIYLRNQTVYVAGLSSVAVRQNGAWTRRAPPAGVRAFLDIAGGFSGDDLVLYGITRNALYVSTDGGESWSQSGLPPVASSLRAVAASLHHGETAYLSYMGNPGGVRAMGVVKTADRGRTWDVVWKDGTTTGPNMTGQWLEERFGPGWPGSPSGMGVAPNDPDTCYGTDNGRTVKTSDGGKTWHSVYSKHMPDGGWTSSGLDVTTNWGVHFDPFDPRHMFIGYTDVGLFGSENGGKSWFSATSGVPRGWDNTTYWLAFDPQVKGRLWAAMSGAHDLPRPKMWQGMAPTHFTGGVCRSDDGARSWDCASDLPQTACTYILLDPASPVAARVLYATGFGRGVFKSADGGKHWALQNQGIPGKELFTWRLAGDPRGTLYVVVARRSNDGGIGNEGDGALYRSSDGAAHWSPVKLPPEVNGPHGLAVDPRDGRRLYLAAWGRRPQDATIGGGIYLSADGGATWRHVLDKDQHIGDITIDPRNPRIVYATGFEGNVWRSADRGASWQRIRGFNFKWGQRVIPDPVDASKIYVMTYGGSVWHGPAKGDPAATEDVAQ
jgi:photosystem II stability/assembly factor-like uncharacterized protein